MKTLPWAQGSCQEAAEESETGHLSMAFRTNRPALCPGMSGDFSAKPWVMSSPSRLLLVTNKKGDISLRDFPQIVEWWYDGRSWPWHP